MHSSTEKQLWAYFVHSVPRNRSHAVSCLLESLSTTEIQTRFSGNKIHLYSCFSMPAVTCFFSWRKAQTVLLPALFIIIIMIIDHLWHPISKEPRILTDISIYSFPHTHFFKHTHTPFDCIFRIWKCSRTPRCFVVVVVVQVSATLYLLKKRLKGESVVNEQVFLQGGHDIFLQHSTHHERRTKKSIRINQSNQTSKSILLQQGKKRSYKIKIQSKDSAHVFPLKYAFYASSTFKKKKVFAFKYPANFLETFIYLSCS